MDSRVLLVTASKATACNDDSHGIISNHIAPHWHWQPPPPPPSIAIVYFHWTFVVDLGEKHKIQHNKIQLIVCHEQYYYRLVLIEFNKTVLSHPPIQKSQWPVINGMVHNYLELKCVYIADDSNIFCQIRTWFNCMKKTEKKNMKNPNGTP